MPQFVITIQVSPIHDEQEVYFTDHYDIEVDYLNEHENVWESMKWLKFVPSNGRRPGALHSVPVERLISIAEVQPV